MTELNAVDVLRQAFPELSEIALAPLASMMKERIFAAGTLICREGAYEEQFYVIGKGEVEFTKRFTDDEERRLRTGGPGVYFGEMALVRDVARSANVRALTEVTTLEIGKEAFNGAIQANPVMMLGIMRTLIERMRANDARALDEMRQQKEQIEEAYKELQYQEKLRSEFLTTLAHELRTPLTSASGYLQLMQAGAMSGPALGMTVGKVRGNVDRIISLVNDLLFVQEQELIEPNLRPVSLLALITIVVDELSEEAQVSGCAINIDIPQTIPTLQAEPDGLVRAFTELLENAVKFSPQGGDVSITAEEHEQGVRVHFVDHGVGIQEAFLPRVFKRFERTDRIGGDVFDGVGLGLAIAKHIIENHGGKISVRSEAGKGSTFTVYLPRDGGRAQIGEKAETAAAASDAGEG